MPKIDESIKKIDDVICRQLNNIGSSTRGVISQNILEQLIKLVNHIMVKFYANGIDISLNEVIIEKATEHAQTTSELHTLYKFRYYLQIVTTQYTLDEDGSERLMLKYYKYLMEMKTLVKQYFGITILHNLHKFPLRLDSTLQEYYTKISEKIENYPTSFSVTKSDKYYIQKVKPLFVKSRIYYEVTFTPVDDRKNASKSNRVIAFTKLKVKPNYASKFTLTQEAIEILGQTMPIFIITGWEVSIRDCEFKNFASILTGQKIKVPYPEQRLICAFLTKTDFSLNHIMEFSDSAYNRLIGQFEDSLKNYQFIPILNQCRNIIRNNQSGKNILRYLLYNMNNVIIKNQYSSGYYSSYYEQWINASNSRLSNLYLANGCIPFDSLPFNSSPIGHNPKLNALFECIPCVDNKSELFARLIRNNTESKGQLFTDINEITGFDQFDKHAILYNSKLWSGHRQKSSLKIEHDHVFIEGYKEDTCTIVKKLTELCTSGIDNYEVDVGMWLLCEDYEIDCDEKQEIIRSIFSKSKVGVVYGSAGVGKSTLINHISHYFDDKNKLYLTQTNPAKENLVRKVDAENTSFSTIASFLRKESNDTEYELLVIDECSTVSNKDMVAILEKAQFNTLLLVGDTYQIDAIQFGNWFSMLKYFLPESSVFELTTPHRTKDRYLLELWDTVRNMTDDTKEYIAKESYSLQVDASLLSSVEKDEAILCLNYDGLYGINNINRFLQESNPNPPIQWDIHQYKVGDPILFHDSDRFRPIIHNNMKGTIRNIVITGTDTINEKIQFDIEIPKLITEDDAFYCDFQLIEYSIDDETSIIRFEVHKLESADDDIEEQGNKTVVPFQVAYAVSIHKAQGLEYNSVKLVITDEVEELVTHNVFYTAITRAREKLKIYWTPEVEEKVINRIKPRDISKEVELLKNYLN